MNKSEVAKYIKNKTTINIDSFYRILKHQFVSRKEAVNYLITIKWHVSGTIATKFNDKVKPIFKRLKVKESKKVNKVTNDTMFIVGYLVNTKLDKTFWDNVVSYAAKLKAKIIVIPIGYTNVHTLNLKITTLDTEYIDPLVIPYLSTEKIVHNRVTIYVNVKLGPTTLNPLTAQTRYLKFDSIYAHHSQTMRAGSNSTLEQSPIAWCTGCCNIFNSHDNNYSYTKLGFLITNDIDIRNVHANADGTFQDLNNYVSHKKVTQVNLEAIIYGDLHIGNHDREALDWANQIAKQYNPKYIFLHDFIDGSTVNPHANNYQKFLIFTDLQAELDACVDILKFIKQQTGVNNLLLVDSNHHRFIDRWLESKKLEELTKKERDILSRWLAGGVGALLDEEVKVLPFNFKIGDKTLGSHGDRGTNGSKGSINNSFNSGFNGVEGHSHTPGILGNAERAACLCKLNQSYNQSNLSNWCHSVVLLSIYNRTQHLIKRAI